MDLLNGEKSDGENRELNGTSFPLVGGGLKSSDWFIHGEENME